jgi:hydroxymethylbilane synthase
MKKIRLATRGSKLALKQTQIFRDILLREDPALEVEVVPIKTTGDHIRDVPLAKVGGKGLFVKEIEEALLEGRADVAVHSLKDVPDTIPCGLCLAGFLERKYPFDVFVSNHYENIETLPSGAKVGTSSIRRMAQLLAMRKDIEIVPLRGNVDTRLRKLDMGLDAIILAMAGLVRLGFANRVRKILGPPEFVPAIGQGVIALECREEDKEIRGLVERLSHEETRVAVEAERAFLKTVGGGCQVPLGAYAWCDGGQVQMIGMIAKADGTKVLKAVGEGQREEAAKVGREVATRLLEEGGKEILAELLNQ